MLLETTTIRISQQGKDQLIKLKRATGIRTWNVICRWALCTSLADPSKPLTRKGAEESNVEMTWRTLSGADGEVYLSLLRLRAAQDNLTEQEVLVEHIHRGIGHIAGLISRDGTIEELAALATESTTEQNS